MERDGNERSRREDKWNKSQLVSDNADTRVEEKVYEQGARKEAVSLFCTRAHTDNFLPTCEKTEGLLKGSPCPERTSGAPRTPGHNSLQDSTSRGYCSLGLCASSHSARIGTRRPRRVHSSIVTKRVFARRQARRGCHNEAVLKVTQNFWPVQIEWVALAASGL